MVTISVEASTPILKAATGMSSRTQRAWSAAVQNLGLPRLRLHLRRGRRMARGRDPGGHSLGGHSGRLVLSRMRRAQGRFRDGGVLISPLFEGMSGSDFSVVRAAQ